MTGLKIQVPNIFKVGAKEKAIKDPGNPGEVMFIVFIKNISSTLIMPVSSSDILLVFI